MPLKPSRELLELTLPQLLKKRMQVEPNAVAFREKDLGVWNELSWRDVSEQVRYAGLGLLSLGVAPGDKVGVLADNIPEWAIIELAAQSIGAISIGIYASSVRDEVRYMLDYADVRVVLCEDQEQTDKVLDVRSELPSLQKVIFENPRGMRDYLEDDFFLSWEGLLTAGRKLDKEHPTLFDDHVAQGKPDDVCHFSTTSGTTGRPKAAMLSHRNYLSMAYALHEVDPISPGDDYVSFLPFAWIVEQVFGLAAPLLTGMVVNFPESGETAMDDLKEIGPHMMLGAPRVWEGVQSQIWVKIDESYPFNRWFYRRMMAVGQRAAQYRMQGKPMPPGLGLSYRFAHWALFRPMKDVLGFLRLKRAYTGGAALGPDSFKFFQGMGVNLKQVYGQTETSGLAYVQRDGQINPDSVGKPLPGVEVKISESGEVLTKCEGVCHGYYKREDDFAEEMQNGYFRSGDAGYLNDEGDLVIIDRVGDVMHTGAGHMFSPQFIENKLKFSPFIKEAVVYGDGRDFVTAMINVDPLTVGKWAEDRGLSYTTYADLSQNPEVAKLILTEVEGVNEDLQAEEKLRRFVLLYKLLDADDEELTRTGKVRRGFIGKSYAEILGALYDKDKDKIRIRAEYTYQDGQSASLETDVLVLEPRQSKGVAA